MIPYLKVCDSRSACSEIEGQPVKIVKPANINNEELQSFIEVFEVCMYRNEYFDAFYLISSILETLKVLLVSQLVVINFINLYFENNF